MIQKLQKKFVMMNLFFVSLVLLVVLCIYCYSSYQKVTEESKNDLHFLIQQGDEKVKPKLDKIDKREKITLNHAAGFCVLLDEEEKISSVDAKSVEVSDELAQSVVSYVLSGEKTEGIIQEEKLRFLKQETPEGVKIAFVDMANEQQTMVRIFVITIFIFIGSFFAVLLISYYMARWMIRPVKEAWEQQRQFVADASHELKTPLTVILANTSILLAHKEDTIKKQEKWVEHTKEEAGRMKKLVDDMLYLAKSDACRGNTIKSEISFSELIWECTLHFESIAFEQGIQLDSSIEENIKILGDESSLKQLVGILLDNACKYSQKNGKILVCLYKHYDKVILKVNNTGSEIPKEEINHIFERFYRLDKSRSQNVEGYGLGLSIASTIVMSHKGKIKAESSKEEGTTFIVSIPVIQE